MFSDNLMLLNKKKEAENLNTRAHDLIAQLKQTVAARQEKYAYLEQKNK